MSTVPEDGEFSARLLINAKEQMDWPIAQIEDLKAAVLAAHAGKFCSC